MSPPRTKARVAWTAVLATLGLLLSWAPPANADPPVLPPGSPPTLPTCPPVCLPRPLPPFSFIVVGDSYTSGEGASHTHIYVGNASGKEDWRHQSGFAPAHIAWAYLEMGRHPFGSMTISPTQLQTSWGRDKLYFHASSGAKTEHLNQKQLEKNGDLRNPPQLDDVDTNSQIVYFGLGGNDAGFGEVVGTAFEAYLSKFDPTAPPWQWTQSQAVAMEVGERLQPQKMSQVSANIEQALVNTRESVPTADIVVALYPLAVKPSGNTGTTEVTAETMALMYPFALAVNQAIRDAVARFQARFPNTRVHVFDPNTAGPGGTSVVAGHELGQPDSYFNGVVYRPRMLGQLEKFRSFQESFHPNEAGDAAIGKALATWMAGEFPALFPDGPNFTAVNVNPQASAVDPDDVLALQQAASADPDMVCGTTDADSVCHDIGPFGITLPLDPWFHPRPLPPILGAPAVPGGSDQGSPGGGGGGGGDPSTSIPAAYIPKDPCDIFRPVHSEFYSTVRVMGGPLQKPVTIEGLMMPPRAPRCEPGIGLVFD